MGVNIYRYRNRIKKEFQVEVVTPMFLGGADTDKAELRVPSLKGMLRFWWRATCGEPEISKIKEKENKIFGSIDKKSSISMCIIPRGRLFISKFMKERGATFKVHGHPVHILDYLAYGTHDYIKKKRHQLS